MNSPTVTYQEEEDGDEQLWERAERNTWFAEKGEDLKFSIFLPVSTTE